jgi:hypothetical protein
LRDGVVVEVDGEEDEAGEGGGCGEDEVPAGEPAACGDGLWLWDFDGGGLLGEVDEVAAVGAGGEVGEGLLLLVRGQGVLDEGAELLWPWMWVGVLAGLEVSGHSELPVAGCRLLVECF